MAILINTNEVPNSYNRDVELLLQQGIRPAVAEMAAADSMATEFGRSPQVVDGSYDNSKGGIVVNRPAPPKNLYERGNEKISKRTRGVRTDY